MRSRSVLVGGLLGGFAGAIALVLVGCPASVPDVCSDGCGSDGSSQDGPIVPSGCDLTKDPKDSIACVDDSIGLFVSAGGSDSNAGTKESPLKTIGAALSKTSSQHARVYVCDGTYAEHVKITSAASVYGGFSCADWSYDGKQGKVAPADSGYALDIEDVSSAIAIEDLEFAAIDGQKPGDSSIAIFVANSTNVTLRRVTATAGNGITGGDATSTSNYDAGTAPAGSMADAGDVGANPCVNRCTDSTTSVGGGGGLGALTGLTSGGGQDGGPAIPQNPIGADGIGGAGKMVGCNPGDQGAGSSPADGGAPGASKPGALSASGWTVLSGTQGVSAPVAQGGGGGSGGTHAAGNNGGGGGGGCGGCGGAGGSAGNSGGSSFALLIYQSKAAVDSCALTAGNGGDGKAGGSGQAGQLGGNPGTAETFGCPGGAGGNGGAGAGGAGGAGGSAIAIGYLGTKPTVTGGSQQEGHGGGAGAGGSGGASNDGLAGAAGTKADVQELP